MNAERSDPDALLAALDAARDGKGQGRLKIYLGMSAGVGKTYAMLEAAHRLRAAGVDVVVGLVETHGRTETKALLEGLEVLPRRRVPYGTTAVEELDVEAILARRPAVVLIDELAHANPPGSPHPKRYLDVLDVLAHGIDVRTTLNVQHVDGRTDVVRDITGIDVGETVPDGMLDRADDIELVDIAPDDLLQRLADGKIYAPAAALRARDNFFRPGNLTALRELALRTTADHVDGQLRHYMRSRRITGPWPARQRCIVGVGPSPFSAELVRWTRTMAAAQGAAWTAVVVRTHHRLTDTEAERLRSTVALATALGGAVLAVDDDDVVRGLLLAAQRTNATQIVVGRPAPGPWLWWRLRRSVLGELLRRAGDIDIAVVRADPTDPAAGREGRSWWHRLEWNGRPTSYLQPLLATAAVVALCWTIDGAVGYQAVGMLLLLWVSLLPLWTSQRPVVVTAVATALAWNLLFIPPRLTFAIGTVPDRLTFVLYFIVALTSVVVTSRIRRREAVVRRREERTDRLYQMAQALNAAEGMDDIVLATVLHLADAATARICVLYGEASTLATAEPAMASTAVPDENDRAAIAWLVRHRRPAGRGTTTVPSAAATWYPLLSGDALLGVVGVVRTDGPIMTPDEESLLTTMIALLPAAMDRHRLLEQERRTALAEQSERLYRSLMNTVSHELRTPLTAIVGIATTLRDVGTDHVDAAILLDDILRSGQRLERLVTNLLDMARIESGSLAVRRDWCDMDDMVRTVVADVGLPSADHGLVLEVDDSLPLLYADAVLLEHAIRNVIHNARHHTPAGTTITIGVTADTGRMTLSIADDGSGMPADYHGRVTEMFVQVPGSRPGGTGLGLAITRGFVEAHGGTCTVRGAVPHGTVVDLVIPITMQEGRP